MQKLELSEGYYNYIHRAREGSQWVDGRLAIDSRAGNVLPVSRLFAAIYYGTERRL